MAESISIDIIRSTDQKSITITDETSWAEISGTLESLTSITLNLYTSSTSSADYTYVMSESEILEYTSNGEITLTFSDIMGTTYATDNWYIGQMDGNDSDYISNYEGFGTYYYVKNYIYNQLINGLNTPERDLSTIQPLHFSMLMLKGLEELDTSTVISRDIKFKKRLSALTKLVS